MNKKQQLKDTLTTSKLKKDLVEDFKMLEDSIDERELEIEDKFSKEKKKFSLRTLKDRTKIFKLGLLVSLSTMMIALTLIILILGMWYNLHSDNFILFVICMELLFMLMIWLSYFEECKK